MPETAAFRGWKVQDAIEWFHGIGRLVVEDRRRQLVVNNDVEQIADQAVTSRRAASGRRRVIRSYSISIFAGARVWA
jgi:hypothetical protein